MKAVRFHEHGGPEVLRYEDAPDPVPKGPDQALIRVKACALNHLDIWGRIGPPYSRPPLPHISGCDIAGVVERLPADEKDLKEGMEVVVSPGIGCGRCERCLSGVDNQCRRYTVIGNEVDGGYAELVLVPRRNVIPKPERMDFVQAASVPLSFLTAYHMLVTKARLQAGETVLVHGAGSGVGIAAIQVAKASNANVVATAGTDSKLRKAVELGADYTINHNSKKISEEARKYTGGRGVDVVVEHPGKATWEESIRSVTRGGRIVTCGATTGYDAVTDLRYVFAKEITIFGSYMGGSGELLRVLELFRQRKLRPVVDISMPLSKAKDAQIRMEKSEQFGKIVLTP
ncbi:MAG TPA: zinc-binding dehydrogenase [Nitrososphaerales archaeon]|nr:zinc-binding dehydrogenase [Nitrososphaerales archaeon]